MFEKVFQKFLSLFVTYKKFFFSTILFILLISFIKVVSFLFSDSSIDKLNQDNLQLVYQNNGIPVPSNLSFSGEKVPLGVPSVKIALQKELQKTTFWNFPTLLFHQRAKRWFPIIENILRKNAIPDDFKYVALVESQLSNVVSPQGATGFWQLLATTAKTYGLEVGGNVDERYNVEKSTEAACMFFKESFKQFHNWTLVAASYNRGITGIQNHIDNQEKYNYYDLLMNKETSIYLYRLLAIKEIISRPAVYGFKFSKKDFLPNYSYKRLVIDTTIHNLSSFALSQKINLSILKEFNPWLLSNSLENNSKKKYKIDIYKGNLTQQITLKELRVVNNNQIIDKRSNQQDSLKVN